MSRRSEIQNAYRTLGKEATFYDGMITCSTLPGRVVCGLVWNMGQEKNTRYVNQELKLGEGGRKTAQKSRECKYVANKSHNTLLRCLR